MESLVQNALQEFIALIEQANVNIIEGNYNKNYTDDWLSIEYNGYQTNHTYRVKLYSLNIVLEQAIRKRLTYFLDAEFNNLKFSLLIDNRKDLFPKYERGVKKQHIPLNVQSPITEKLLSLKELFSFDGKLYKHQNLNVNINGAKTIGLDEYKSQISDYIEIAYYSLCDLLEIDDNFAKFRGFFIGSCEEKDRYIKLFNDILEKVRVVNDLGVCILNNRRGKNNRAILWSIKDVFRDKGIFLKGLSDREYIQTLWKYMNGHEPIPEKRHMNKSRNEHYQTIMELFSEFTT